MKKYKLLVALLLPLCLSAQEKQFIIKGKIGKLNNPAVATIGYRINGKDFKDTATITNGEFILKGKLDYPIIGNITVYPAGMKPSANNVPLQGASARLIWLEQGTITVRDSVSLFKAVFSSKVNDEQQEYYRVRDSAFSKGGSKPAAQLNFIKSNKTSPVSLRILFEEGAAMSGMSGGIPNISIVESLFNSLSPAVKNSPTGKAYRDKIATWKKSGVGMKAPDFVQTDNTGKQIKLSAFKGKYVLLDFWASWCHPCRDENPNLRKQYELYKEKGFIILAVSLDGGKMAESKEKSKEAWLKAITMDSVNDFIQACDLSGSDDNKVKKLYGVNSIPENFLIDPNGIIIGKSLSGQGLNDKLEEIFNTATSTTAVQITNVAAPALFDENKLLLLDPTVRTGKLANGFTYFIRKNTEPKNRVTFYLANKVGSILEEDNQQGLAHFMEHMNFNGTTHFPKDSLVNYLQKSGVRFGADLNAYTGFDETVYQLPLPSDKPEVLNSGIQIMRDWAQEALLDPIEINKERGVVLEEKRIGKGAGERMRRQFLPLLLNQSRYANRLPIGTEEVLSNFTPETLQKFYKDWYRPDLQALIVVGDINVDSLESIIKSKFSDLKNSASERQRKEYTVPLTGQNQFIVVTDKEQTKIAIEVIIKHREKTIKTSGDYGNYVLQQLFNSMLSSRFGELTANQSNPPYESGGSGIGSFLRSLNSFSARCVVKPGEAERGFKTVWREIERLKRFGFTQSELNRVRTSFLSRRESAMLGINKTSSDYFVNDYLQYFLKDVAAVGIPEELALTKSFLPTVTLADFKILAKQYIIDTDRDILVMGPEKEKATLPDEQKIKQWMDEVASEDIIAYKDNFSENKLLSKEPVPGKIISEKIVDAIKATEWILSNGAKVILKKTDFSDNLILFNAFAPGGSSVYSDSDYQSATNAAFLFDQSGLGNYKFSDLNKFLNGKDLFSGTGINDYDVTIQGGTSQKDALTFLQVIHAKFTEPKYDKAAFEGAMAKYKSNLQGKSISPESIFQDTLIAVLNNYNIRRTPFDSSKLAQINFEKCIKIYKEIFEDASRFTFIFSGPLDTAKIKPLVEKYIASLPSTHKPLQPKNFGLHPPEGNITKKVFKGTEPKAKVNLSFSGTYTFKAVNNKILDALKEVLQIKLLQRLREQESGAYSPSVLVAYEKIPQQRYRLRIAFDCAPENIDKLIAAALDEVNKLKVNGPDEESIEKFKAEDRSNEELQLKSDFVWLQYIKQQLLNHEDLNEVNEYDTIIKQVTKESLKDAANKYLSSDNLIRFILLPENYKN